MRTGSIAVLCVLLATGAVLLLSTDLLDPDPPEPGTDGAVPAGPTPHASSDRAAAPRLGGEPAGGTPAGRTSSIPAGAFELIGGVVDDRRRPVPGARVWAWTPAGAVHARVSEATTDERGRYRLLVRDAGSRRIGIPVTAELGSRGARNIVYLRPSRSRSQKVKALVLGTLDTLRVRVENRSGNPVADAIVVLQLLESGPPTIVGRAVADAQGRATLRSRTARSYRILASAPGHGRATHVSGRTDARGGETVLTLPSEHRLRVYVRTRDTREPVEGAAIRLLENVKIPRTVRPWRVDRLPWSRDPVTDAHGHATFEGLASDEVLLLTVSGTGLGGGHRSLTHVPAHADEVTVEVERLAERRFPLASDNPHTPPTGSVLEVLRNTWDTDWSPGRAYIDENELVLESAPGEFTVRVVAENGAFAVVSAKKNETARQEVAFKQQRQIRVTLRHPDYAPATGYYVAALEGPTLRAGPTPTDAGGRVQLELATQAVLTLTASTRRDYYRAKAVARVDLREKVREEVELVVPRMRDLVLRVKIDGEYRLPTTYSVATGHVVSEDAEEGRTTLRVSEELARVTLRSPGFRPATIDLPPRAPADRRAVDVELLRGATVQVKWRAPAGGNAAVALVPTGPDTNTGAGQLDLPYDGIEEEQSDDGWQLRRYIAVRPGTYLARDRRTGAASSTITVREGDDATIELDLRRLGWATGRVRVPDDFDLQGEVDLPVIRTYVDGKRLHTNAGIPGRGLGGVPVGRDGTFRVPIMPGRAVRLVPWHPLLVPGESGGTIELAAPRTGISLQLVRGVTCHLILGEADALAKVYLRRTDRRDNTLEPVFAMAEGDGLRLPNVAPGVYDIFVDRRGWEPLLLRAKRLEGGSKLQLPPFTRGASIRLRPMLPPGKRRPTIRIEATHVEHPNYTRMATLYPEDDLVLRGLGKGRFRVTVTVQQMPTHRHEQMIESDGFADIPIDFDLR